MSVIKYCVGNQTRGLLRPIWSDTISSASVAAITDSLYGDSAFIGRQYLYISRDGELILVLEHDGLWQRCMRKKREKRGDWPLTGSMQEIIERYVRMRIHQYRG